MDEKFLTEEEEANAPKLDFENQFSEMGEGDKLIYLDNMLQMGLLRTLDAMAQIRRSSDEKNFPDNFIADLVKLQVDYLGAMRSAPEVLSKFGNIFGHFYCMKMDALQKIPQNLNLH